MNKIKTGFGIIYFLFLAGCRTGADKEVMSPQKDIIVHKYPDGQTRAIFEVLKYPGDSSIRHGHFTTYHSNGQVEIIAFYKNDIQDSVQFSYYPNGNLHEKTFRVDGKLFGQQYAYYEDGTIKIVLFSMDDTSFLYEARYEQGGKLVKVDGRALWVNAFKDLSTVKVGEEIYAGNTVMRLPDAITKLHLRVTDPSGKLVSDTSMSKFGSNLNAYWYVYENTFYQPGKYVYDVSVKVVDSATGKEIRSDKVTNIITVVP